MNFHILTLFPEMVMNGLMTSITGRAVQQNKITIEAVNIRDHTENKHGKVDDYPYGGGAGMLMQAQPVYAACESVLQKLSEDGKRRIIYVTPQGRPFDQKLAGEFAKADDLILLCGHYEGIDERVLEEVVTDYVSIGDYVLTGGELAAMVIVDAVARLVPDVLHNKMSAQTESLHGNLLEYPQYSRPEEWHGKRVPDVLLSGNQKKIEEWRLQESRKRTKERRPDLYGKYQELQECREILMKQKLLHADMIELVHRGRAELAACEKNEMLLKDGKTGLFYHANLNRDEKKTMLDWSAGLRAGRPENIVIHQKEMIPVLEKYGYSVKQQYIQAVCTRKEKLPVSGLHKEQTAAEDSIRICPLQGEGAKRTELELSAGWKKIQEGTVYGCFFGETPAGYTAFCEDGSIRIPEVYTGFRGKKVAASLVVCMINHQLEQGMMPYIHIPPENEAAKAMLEKLGLCFGKTVIYRMEKEM